MAGLSLVPKRATATSLEPGGAKSMTAAPTAAIGGRWDVTVQYTAGMASHKLFLALAGNKVTGTHFGWALDGKLSGVMNGDRVRFQSALPAGGQTLHYTFDGKVEGDAMSGELEIGEYGKARWTARRQA